VMAAKRGDAVWSWKCGNLTCFFYFVLGCLGVGKPRASARTRGGRAGLESSLRRERGRNGRIEGKKKKREREGSRNSAKKGSRK
jgi:hypothetical protein